ncbi:MAG: hypothetical protein LBV02_02505 [Bacteroidales bacterium]|jgi:hypothetical protein|nr:hypothetical protein [Bacteroidales bacterium]
MLKKFNILVVTLIILMGIHIIGNAQTGISSPYSGFGIGILSNTTNASLSAMGGTSYAIQSNRFVNYKNPASYIAFDSLSFIADVAFSTSSISLKNTDMNQKNTLARFNYLTIGFSVAKFWRTSLGVLPFSDVGYKINDTGHEGYSYRYEGDGGLNQVYWGNAFRLTRNLSIGLNLSYLWGTLHDTRYAEYNENYFFNTRIDQRDKVDGLYLSAGLQYFLPLKENHKLGFGLVYENSAYIGVKQDLMIGNYTGEYDASYTLDTIVSTAAVKGTMKLPQSIGAGLSYSFKNVWLIGADVTWQNWKKFESMGKSDSLSNNWITSIGLQYCADPASPKFFKKLRYRAGFKHSTGYLTLNEKVLSEYNISLGIGIPLQTFNTNSTINIVFEYGRMGTTSYDLILQDYLKISFNFILQEKWYQRTRLE